MSHQEKQGKKPRVTGAPSDENSIFSFGSLGGDAAGSGEVDLRIAKEKDNWLDRFLEKAGDSCSSIVVKETRQSIKSRQFVWTFFATILITLIVTLFNLSDWSTASRLGQTLLMAYLVIMGLPLMIIVPLSVFQSLASEQNDGTLQLISITTMKPLQIVLGKLGSAALQIVIYMSVLAPCVTFTYLLRGVDIYQILASLSCGFGISLSLCCLGLVLASVSTTRMSAGVFQLFFVAILLVSAWMWSMLSWGLTAGFGFIDSEIGFFIAAWACAILSFAALFLVAATAQITFVSDNRSTYLRIAMLVQQTLFVAFCIGLMSVPWSNSPDTFHFMLLVALHYWLFMGSIMTATSPQLSNRARRSMPRTLLGSRLGGLLMPGPGRAYLFSWANGIFCCGLMVVYSFLFNTQDDTFGFVFLSVIYFSLYLSASYIFNRIVSGRSKEPFLAAGVLGLGLVMFMPSVVGTLLQSIDYQHSFFGRGFLACLNWYTANAMLDRGGGASGGLGWVAGILMVVIASLLTTGYAMLSSSREFIVSAIATPRHVLDEDRDFEKRDALGNKEEIIDDIFAD